MEFEQDYQEFEDMPIAYRMAMIDAWDDEYRKTLADIRERNEALKSALKAMEDKAP
ncbi:hypothetical protein [Neorhizobium sp. NCHU2750]|uniref:hypothetical protein n=1 Tax=Neorhizobium sp. NCHU2750 TaxID=1825976 RepID=UPI000EB75B74|nr:hypothetical protein NCHU2750_23720 [Neorhizobium sp. NCHU2750]